MRLAFMLFVLLSILFLASCGVTYHLALPAAQPLTEQFVSPDTGCHQGYATDGTTHFTFDTGRILARSNPSWRITAVNDTPFNGLTGYNHLGDGDYFEQKLYVPAEQYRSCSNHGNPAILVFDSSTLARVSVFPLRDNQEISGVVVVPESRQLWVSSYCDGSKLWIYNLDDMTFFRTVPLSPAVPGIQGLAYHGSFFYLAQNSGTIRRMYLDGVSEQVYATASPGAHEGVDYSQNELRWLIDEGRGEQKIHFLVPKQP